MSANKLPSRRRRQKQADLEKRQAQKREAKSQTMQSLGFLKPELKTAPLDEELKILKDQNHSFHPGGVVEAGEGGVKGLFQFITPSWPSQTPGFSPPQINVSIQNTSNPHSPVPWLSIGTESKEEKMIRASIDHALALLEEPLFNPAEHQLYNMVQFTIFKRAQTEGPVAGIYNSAINWCWDVDGNISSTLYLLELSGMNRSYFFPRYFPDQKGGVPILRAELGFSKTTVDPKDFRRVAEKTLAECIRTQMYFDFPLYGGVVSGDLVFGHARFRAKWEGDFYKLVALVTPTFNCVDRLETRTYPVPAPLILNIWEGKASDPDLALENVESAFVASLDAVLDLEVGFNYDCDHCNVSATQCDPMSADRLALALVGLCNSCFYRQNLKDDFGTAVPSPF